MEKDNKTPAKKPIKKKPTAKTPAKRGAPSKFTKALFDKVINKLSFSELSIRNCCKEAGIVPGTFYKWIEGDDDLLKQYARARELQAEYLFDLIRDVCFDRSRDNIAFTGGNNVQRDKLIVDSLKWQASKLNSKKYGDRIEVDQKTEHSGKIDFTIIGMRIIDSGNELEEGTKEE